MERIYWLIPTILAILFNANVLLNGYGWDDEVIIDEIQSGVKWIELLLPDWGDPPKTSSAYYRPLVSLSYRLDYIIFGKTPIGFHLTVYLAHIINTLLVFFLARHLWLMQCSRSKPGSLPEPRDSPNGEVGTFIQYTPLVASSLFAVHPIHSEAVAWIAGRNDVFCASLVLASFLCYAMSHPFPKDEPHKARSQWRVFYFASMVFFFLSLLTKEAAVGLVFLFPLYDYLIPNQGRPRIRILCLRALTPLLLLTLYFMLRSIRLSSPYGGVSGEPIISGNSLLEALSAFGLYLRLYLFPFPHLPYIPALPDSLHSWIFTFFILCVIVWGFMWSLKQNYVLPVLGLGWGVIMLGPALAVSILDVAITPAAERYVYIPSVGLSIVAAWLLTLGAREIVRYGASPRKVLWMTGGGLALLLFFGGAVTFYRNTSWRDSIRFWEVAAAQAPGAGFPHRELGKHLAAVNRNKEAESHYLEAIRLDRAAYGDDNWRVGETLHALGTVYYKDQRYSLARQAFTEALALRQKVLGPTHVDTADTMNNLALLHYDLGQYNLAEPLFLEAIGIYEALSRVNEKDFASMVNNLAALYYAEEKYDQAEPLYRKSLEIREGISRSKDSEIAGTLNNLAALYYQQGKYDESEDLFRQSLEMKQASLGENHPDLAPTLSNLASILINQQRYDEAESLFRKAIQIREMAFGPDHPKVVSSLENYAVLLRKMDRFPEAAAMEQRIVRIKGTQEIP